MLRDFKPFILTLLLWCTFLSTTYGATCVELGEGITWTGLECVGGDLVLNGAGATVNHASIEGALTVTVSGTINNSIISGAVTVAADQTLSGTHCIFEATAITGDGAEDLTNELWSQAQQWVSDTDLRLRNGAAAIGAASDTFTDSRNHTGNDIGAYETDNVPTAFSFTDKNAARMGRFYASNAITVAGIDVAIAISVEGGTYSKNGSGFTSDPDTVEAGDVIVVRGLSSLLADTATNVVLTIGGVSDTFTITTSVGHGGGGGYGYGYDYSLYLPDEITMFTA